MDISTIIAGSAYGLGVAFFGTVLWSASGLRFWEFLGVVGAFLLILLVLATH